MKLTCGAWHATVPLAVRGSPEWTRTDTHAGICGAQYAEISSLSVSAESIMEAELCWWCRCMLIAGNNRESVESVQQSPWPNLLGFRRNNWGTRPSQIWISMNDPAGRRTRCMHSSSTAAGRSRRLQASKYTFRLPNNLPHYGSHIILSSNQQTGGRLRYNNPGWR